MEEKWSMLAYQASPDYVQNIRILKYMVNNVVWDYYRRHIGRAGFQDAGKGKR